MMKALLSNLKRFLPALAPVSTMERLRACFGALLGVFVTGVVSEQALGATTAVPLLIAPMGASAVLLFAVPSSPLAQPWSIIVGNMVAALIGVTCAIWIPDLVIASAVGVSLAILAMIATRSLHPPSGAVALTAVLGGPVVHNLGYGFVLWPVGLNSLLLLIAALAYNNLTGRRYPHIVPVPAANVHKTADPLPTRRIGFTPADLDSVLRQYDEVLNISPDDLDAILHKTEMQAYRRRFGEVRCEQIMSTDLATVKADTPLHLAWALLVKHRIKALPVVNAHRNIIGIVTQTDFMENANWDRDGDLHIGLARRLRRAVKLDRRAHRTVADIMTSEVQFVRPQTLVTDLVPAMADRGLHHLPVADDNDKLVGMVTQSDLIAALYSGNLTAGRPDEPLTLAG